jgi:cytochrome P450 family 6
LTAQATVFFIAGFETSSAVLSCALLELAVNSDLQKRAREEIEEVIERNDGQITYQGIQEMKYIDSILEGILRTL